MSKELFTTHITFTSGDTHKEEPVDAEGVVSTITRLLVNVCTRLLRGPAAALGIVKEFKIVDMSDRIVFLARDNNVVFPKQNKTK